MNNHNTGHSANSHYFEPNNPEYFSTSLDRLGDITFDEGHPRPVQSKQYREAALETRPGEIEVRLNDDRCYPGLIRFGDTECKTIGKSVHHACPSPASLIPSPLQDDQNGDTPLGRYEVTPREKDGAQPHWGNHPLRMTRQPAMKTEAGGERAGFLIHANTNAEKRGENIGLEIPMPPAPKNHVSGTFGCLKVHSACLDALYEYVSKNKGKVVMNIRDQNGKMDPKIR